MDSKKKTFDNRMLGLHLELSACADDFSMEQHSAFLLAYQKGVGADGLRTLKAALESGWVTSFTKSDGTEITAKEVPTLKPAKIGLWASDQINKVFQEACSVPNE